MTIQKAKLIVGLGNPGKKYRNTRHNIGARVAKYLEGLSLPESVQLFFPPDDVFMNQCGPSIAAHVRQKHFIENEILIICDDFMLPFGQLRIRTKGSSGGHNGLQSVIDAFGTPNVPRLRIGVGLVPENRDPADFVLENFEEAGFKVETDLVTRGADAAIVCAKDGYEVAMNKYNPKMEPKA